MKFFALKKPGEDRVWLCWGMYRTAVPNMDVLSGLQFLGICGAVTDGVPAFIDGLVEIPWGSTGVGGTVQVDYDRIIKGVADELYRRLAG